MSFIKYIGDLPIQKNDFKNLAIWHYLHKNEETEVFKAHFVVSIYWIIYYSALNGYI